MEKDRFDDTLKRLVVKADQMRSNSSDRERVWENINRPQQVKKIWYYAVAAVILCLTIGLLNWPKPEPEMVKIVQQLKKAKPELPVVVQKEIVQHSLKTTSSKKAQEISFVDTIIEQIALVKPKNDTPVKQDEIALNTNPIAPNVLTENTIPKEQPFTVQFKRGSIPVVQEEAPALKVVLKKFSFKRDTLYYANQENISRKPLKIKF